MQAKKLALERAQPDLQSHWSAQEKEQETPERNTGRAPVRVIKMLGSVHHIGSNKQLLSILVLILLIENCHSNVLFTEW